MNKINDNLYTFEGQQDIVSPQLVYYPAIIRENIRKMIDIAGGAARLWPHIKTHKMAEVVQMQIEAGIDRFKCATIAEAEMAAKAGAKHLTLAYPLVGPNIKRFAALQAAFPEVEFFAIGDDTEQIRKLGQTCKANVLMDVDMGQHRTGVPLDKVEAMYREWNTLPGIVMRGMHCYDGHRHESSVQEREVATAPVDKQIEEIKARLKADGICCEILIMGGTPSFPVHAEMTGEFLSPGTCVIQDAGYRKAYPDLKFTPAAALLTRVVSRPSRDTFTLDLGLMGSSHKAARRETSTPAGKPNPSLTPTRSTACPAYRSVLVPSVVISFTSLQSRRSVVPPEMWKSSTFWRKSSSPFAANSAAAACPC